MLDKFDDARTPMKAMLWEEAKGKLRALAAVQGSYQAHSEHTERWEQCTAAIEKFIADFQGDALHE